jgi:hypothetical protein
MDMSLFTGAISSLQGINDIVRGTVSLKVAQDVAGKIISIQQDMLNMQSAMMALQQENIRLLNELKTANDSLFETDTWKNTSDRFELKKFPAGDHVYTLKDHLAGSPEYVCPKCFEDKKKYTLKLHMSHRGGETYSCPTCSNKYKLFPHGEPPQFVQDEYDPFSQIR